MQTNRPRRSPPHESEIDAVLTGSRALVAAAARSLAAIEELEVSLPQYRVLVLLAARGPQRVQALADALGVNPSTATRAVDRLVSRELARRRRSADDRREVRVSLTGPGRELLDRVTARRRDELARILAGMEPDDRAALARALAALADAAGEPPDVDWLA